MRVLTRRPHKEVVDVVDVAVIGGGPAGAAAGRLLASWGHAVFVLDKAGDPARGLAESIPPSTHKLLAQIGVLDAVDRANFYRTRGNTAWWGSSRQRRVESFSGGAQGYQVFRPDFDRVLLECAAEAGAVVRSQAHVRGVTFGDPGDPGDPAEDVAFVEYEHDGRRAVAAARFVLDCSGRAGVIGRRFRVLEPGHRTFGLIGVWHSRDGWELPDETHTAVETFGDGWAWSVPTSKTTRHVGVMLGSADPASPSTSLRAGLERRYRAQIARTEELSRTLSRASLERVWACDASLYSSSTYAGRQFLLVGDAGSFIDPLSSYGVKKALASAWLGAVTVHTALTHPERSSVALEFFSNWERRVYAQHLERSLEFRGRSVKASRSIPSDSSETADAGEIARAFERIRSSPGIDLVMAPDARVDRSPVVRGREIVLEPALTGGLRFASNVDLLKLAEMAPRHRRVPDLFEAYCRACPPVPLPNVVGALSMLVARGILHERT